MDKFASQTLADFTAQAASADGGLRCGGVAALAGALLCRLLWPVAGPNVSMSAGFALVVVIRLCSAYFRWSLPKARGLD